MGSLIGPEPRGAYATPLASPRKIGSTRTCSEGSCNGDGTSSRQSARAGPPHPAGGLPALGAPAGPAGEQRLPFRRERDAENGARMGGPDERRAIVTWVPQPDRPLKACRNAAAIPV